MELTVLSHNGVPESGVLSIRAGSVRRQATIAALGKPLKFPNAPEDCVTFKVDVMDLLGSARLAYIPQETDYALSLDPVAAGGWGKEPAAMDIAFRVTRATGGVAGPNVLPEGGSPMPGSLEGANAENASGEEAADAREKQNKERTAKEYLEKHGITRFMQYLMQSLMKDKPEDPYAFLQREITKRMVSAVPRIQESEIKDMDLLMAKLSAGESPPPEVTSDQLNQLERQTEEAVDKLRVDNASLRETAELLKSKYAQILKESEMLQTAEAGCAYDNVPRPTDTNPQVEAYMKIAQAQEDISFLANENHTLVENLASMRRQIEGINDEIKDLQTS